MNKNLDAAIVDIAKADAILSIIDEVYMEDAEGRLQYLHLTLCDIVRDVMKDLELLAEDQRVVDAIYAANDARRHCTLKQE